MKFTPSPYQQAVFDFIKHGTGSAIVKAVAGAGKTTTIVQALELIPATQKVTFLAFNKKIATELQTRVPKHVKAATFHSQGYAAWRRLREDVGAPDSNKCRELVKKHFSQVDAQTIGPVCIKLVSMAKNAGVGVLLSDTVQTWQDLADHYDIQLSDSPADRVRVIEAAQRLLRLSVEAAMASPSSIDFDDMLYMPLLKDAPFWRSDWLFVDESQDTNGVQLALLKRMLKSNGRLVAVGDERQAIYGFRGADAAAMRNLKEAFNCQELPLTISYRCAQNVVKLAQTLVPYIEAAPTAPAGEVIDDQPIASANFNNNDVIICRNTAPIVELAYQLIGKGVGCKVLGREIGQALAALIDKMKAKDVDELINKLDAFAERECAKFVAKGQDQKAEGVRDKVDCIKAIANNLSETDRTISAVLASIERMFSDSGDGLLTLCTAHKSKGLEWDRVFIYRQDLMPSRWARQAWQLEQEHNLMYVAWTRAKRILAFLSETPVETCRAKALRVMAAKGKTFRTDFWEDT